MKTYSILFLLLMPATYSFGQQKKIFNIFSYATPAGFKLKEQTQRLFFEKIEGNSFCQLYVWPAQQGTNDPDANFKSDWDYFAAKPYQLTAAPEKQTEQQNGWDVVTGVSPVTKEGLSFIVTVSTFTQNSISWCAITVFNDEKYLAPIDEFLMGVKADSKKFIKPKITPAVNTNTTTTNNITTTANNTGITKSTTNFDDGWTATVANDYVKVAKTGIELRLHYIDKALDDARPNTIDAPEYYWSKYVEPYYNVPSPEKWSGVQYPVIYHLQGNATDRKTGKACFVAIKIVYNGGARPIVVIAPNQNSYLQQFPHPNDIDPMLNSNRFAVTANDITGTWKGGGGGGVEYYSVYSGNYTGMSAVSSTDEFTFNKDGSYSSIYRSASMNNSGAQFGGQDFNGKYTVTDWSITATNRYKGKTTKYNAQLIAVKGGYLLYMEDADNNFMKYTLFKAR